MEFTLTAKTMFRNVAGAPTLGAVAAGTQKTGMEATTMVVTIIDPLMTVLEIVVTAIMVDLPATTMRVARNDQQGAISSTPHHHKGQRLRKCASVRPLITRRMHGGRKRSALFSVHQARLGTMCK